MYASLSVASVIFGCCSYTSFVVDGVVYVVIDYIAVVVDTISVLY